VRRRWPSLDRKEREEALLKEHLAVFLLGIGFDLSDGAPHEVRNIYIDIIDIDKDIDRFRYR